MPNPRFKKTRRLNRLTALCIAIFFHAGVFGGAYYFAEEDASIKDLVPEFVKEWFDDGGEKSDIIPVKDRA